MPIFFFAKSSFYQKEWVESHVFIGRAFYFVAFFVKLMIIGIPSGLSPAVLIGEVREGVEGKMG